MKFDREEFTGRLRYVDKTEFLNEITSRTTKTLQQEYKCLIDGRYKWRDVPIVNITELGND